MKFVLAAAVCALALLSLQQASVDGCGIFRHPCRHKPRPVARRRLPPVNGNLGPAFSWRTSYPKGLRFITFRWRRLVGRRWVLGKTMRYPFPLNVSFKVLFNRFKILIRAQMPPKGIIGDIWYKIIGKRIFFYYKRINRFGRLVVVRRKFYKLVWGTKKEIYGLLRRFQIDIGYAALRQRYKVINGPDYFYAWNGKTRKMMITFRFYQNGKVVANFRRSFNLPNPDALAVINKFMRSFIQYCNFQMKHKSESVPAETHSSTTTEVHTKITWQTSTENGQLYITIHYNASDDKGWSHKVDRKIPLKNDTKEERDRVVREFKAEMKDEVDKIRSQ